MATVTITNLSSTDALYISDLYVTIPASGSVTAERSASDLAVMASLQEAVNSQQATVSIAYSADEKGSGFVLDSGVPVSSTAVESGTLLLRIAMANGGDQEVTVYAVDDMPHSFRVVDHWMQVSTADTGDVTVQNEAGGAPGTTYLTVSHAATGQRLVDAAATASPVVANGAGNGFVVRRASTATELELYLLVRPEL